MARLLARWIDVRREELAALLFAFAYFFCLLAGSGILRPIRDEMGLSRGVDQLPVIWTGTFLAMTVASPLFAAIASRFPRQKLIPWTYHFFALNLVGFFALWSWGIGRNVVPYAFYIWAAVYNLFVVSVFWSLMTDLFSNEQGKRLFGFIAAGGSVGALTGPILTALLVKVIGGAKLLLVAAAFLELSVIFVLALVAWARRHPRPHEEKRQEEAVGGNVWSGLKPVATSTYLLASAGYIFLLTVGNTFLYFQQMELVAAATEDRATRTQLFGTIDAVVNATTLLLQTLVTGKLLKRLGVTVGLSVAPVLTAVGFAALAMAPLLRVIAVFQGGRRAAQYAILRPSRELLFTVVSREARYKSKNFIDTVVFRGGDMVSAWLYAGLGAAGLGFVGIAWLSVPVSLVWLVLGIYLGREQKRRAGETA